MLPKFEQINNFSIDIFLQLLHAFRNRKHKPMLHPVELKTQMDQKHVYQTPRLQLLNEPFHTVLKQSNTKSS